MSEKLTNPQTIDPESDPMRDVEKNEKSKKPKTNRGFQAAAIILTIITYALLGIAYLIVLAMKDTLTNGNAAQGVLGAIFSFPLLIGVSVLSGILFFVAFGFSIAARRTFLGILSLILLIIFAFIAVMIILQIRELSAA